MGKNSGGSEVSNANNYYNQVANDANAMVGNFNQYDLPLMQTLDPILLRTLMGDPTALTRAAQAPVLANASSALNTLRSNPSGAVNPNALYQDMILNGNQQAGLAGDQMLNTSLGAIQNILGLGYGSVGQSMNALNSAAGGEANLGLNLNEQGNEWWKALLGAAGTAAGMMYGVPVQNNALGSQSYGFNPGQQASVYSAAQSPVPLAPVPTDYSWMVGPSGTTSTVSTPISGVPTSSTG
jgi:hypothetical protein